MNKLDEISQIIKDLNTDEDVCNFLRELFTEAELEDLSKRWCILKMLNDGFPQRDIAKKLKVSLCKITRGSKILKNNNTITAKYLKRSK